LEKLQQKGFRHVLEKLRKNVAGIQALILVGPEGVVEHIVEDGTLDLETIVGEYTTLLRVARSASEDSGAGDLVENIVVSERSIMIARSIASELYLILLSRSQDQIGRARYEVKQAAWEIRGQTPNSSNSIK
jgi:predicted regulator of Ras-like GTPase activity (Roadblock/LC7/MglB family)